LSRVRWNVNTCIEKRSESERPTPEPGVAGSVRYALLNRHTRKRCIAVAVDCGRSTAGDER